MSQPPSIEQKSHGVEEARLLALISQAEIARLRQRAIVMRARASLARLRAEELRSPRVIPPRPLQRPPPIPPRPFILPRIIPPIPQLSAPPLPVRVRQPTLSRAEKKKVRQKQRKRKQRGAKKRQRLKRKAIRDALKPPHPPPPPIRRTPPPLPPKRKRKRRVPPPLPPKEFKEEREGKEEKKQAPIKLRKLRKLRKKRGPPSGDTYTRNQIDRVQNDKYHFLPDGWRNDVDLDSLDDMIAYFEDLNQDNFTYPQEFIRPFIDHFRRRLSRNNDEKEEEKGERIFYKLSYMLRGNEEFRTLSTGGLAFLTNYMTLKTVGEEETVSGLGGSDLRGFTTQLFNMTDLQIDRLETDKRPEGKSVAFFNRMSSSIIDMSDMQIYNIDNIIDPDDDKHCLLFALEQAGLTEEDLTPVAVMFVNDKRGHVSTKTLHLVARVLNRTLVVHKYRNNGSYKTDCITYETENDKPEIELAIYDEHIFHYKITPHKRWLFKHKYFYKRFKKNPSAYKSVRKPTRKKDMTWSFKTSVTAKSISNLQLVRYLDDLGEFYYDSRLYNFVQHQVPSEIPLENIEDEQGVKEPPKKPKMKDVEVFYADYESGMWSDTENKIHNPLYLGVKQSGGQYKEYRRGKGFMKMAMKMAFFVSDNTKYKNKKKAVVYFHNLKYDLHLIFKEDFRVSKVLYQGGIYYGATIYFKGVTIQLLDSYKMIALSLGSFNKTFKLNKGKMEALAYDYHTVDRYDKKSSVTVEEYLKFMSLPKTTEISFDKKAAKDPKYKLREALIQNIRSIPGCLESETFIENKRTEDEIEEELLDHIDHNNRFTEETPEEYATAIDLLNHFGNDTSRSLKEIREEIHYKKLFDANMYKFTAYCKIRAYDTDKEMTRDNKILWAEEFDIMCADTTLDAPQVYKKAKEKIKAEELRIKRFTNEVSEMTFDPWVYYEYYLKQDVYTLEEGMEAFNDIIMKAFGQSIFGVWTVSSLACSILNNEGCYKGVIGVSGYLRKFLDSSIRGGRVFVNKYKRAKLIKESLTAIDLVSMYPSAMSRLKLAGYGCPIGEATIIPVGEEDFVFKVDSYQYYVVEINITKVNKKREIPIIVQSFEKKTGRSLEYTNKAIGLTVIDKITLEDYIKYHEIEYEFVRGVYWNKGFNTQISDTIEKMFTQRLKAKLDKNTSLSSILKLILNSSYGKHIMKQVESKSEIVRNNKKDWCKVDRSEPSDKNLDQFLFNNFHTVKAAMRINPSQTLVSMKDIDTSYSYSHIGGMILSMSKRIANEIFDVMEQLGIPLYYSDTDSLHFPESGLEPLKKRYKEIYGKDLCGDEMGQSHVDFELNYTNYMGEVVDAVGVYGEKALYYDKKVYCERTVGYVSDSRYAEKIKSHNFRMKGFNSQAVIHKAKTDYNGNLLDLYIDICDNKITIDNVVPGSTIRFKYNKMMSVYSATTDIRSIGGKKNRARRMIVPTLKLRVSKTK